jgi:hypothetical protein
MKRIALFSLILLFLLISACAADSAKTASATPSPSSIVISPEASPKISAVTPSLSSGIQTSETTPKAQIDYLEHYTERFTEKYKYTGVINETYNDRHFKLEDTPENFAEELASNFYYYNISGKYDKLYDIYGEDERLKLMAINEKMSFEKGDYIKEYVVHSLSTLTKESFKNASTYYFKKALVDLEKFKLTDITVIKAEISMAWSEKALSGGPQLKDGRYVRFFLCGKASVSDSWKVYEIL